MGKGQWTLAGRLFSAAGISAQGTYSPEWVLEPAEGPPWCSWAWVVLTKLWSHVPILCTSLRPELFGGRN